MAAIYWEPIRYLAFSDISAVYTAIGTPFSHAIRLLKITNYQNAAITLSFNATEAHIFVGAGSYAVFDLATNRPTTVGNNDCQIPKGSQLYVASSGTPTQGSVWVECIYTDGD